MPAVSVSPPSSGPTAVGGPWPAAWLKAVVRSVFACKATVDMFGLTMEDFVPQVEDIISVGEFYDNAAGGQIVFT